MANRNPVLIFVAVLIVLYLLLTYSYAGYTTPNFPEETRNRDIYQGPGFILQSDSVADRAVKNAI